MAVASARPNVYKQIGTWVRGPSKREDPTMKATVNEDCIGCGMCEGTCPDVFALNDDGVAEAQVEEVPADAEDSAQEAADNCPVSAIELD